MTTRIPISDLDLVGYVGRFHPEEAPRRLMPVYKSRAEGREDEQSQVRILVPPTSEEGGQIVGEEVSESHLACLAEEEELTLLATPLPVRSDHLLWLSRGGPRYQRADDAEREMEMCAVEAVRHACEAGLESEGAADLLFAALRARWTVMASALLAVHFVLLEQHLLARPLRDDLTSLADQGAHPLDRSILEAVMPFLARDRRLATAVAMEVGRARREDLAQAILRDLPPPARSAAAPAPPLSWSATRWSTA